MVLRIVKLLGVFAVILSLILAYPLWCAYKNLGDNDSNLFWLMFLFVTSIVGTYGAWKEVKQLVWIIAKMFVIFSVYDARITGLLTVPLTLLFVVISILLYHNDKKDVDSWDKYVSFIKGKFRTKKTKILGWVGYLIVMASVWVDGIIRYYNGHLNTIWLYVTIAIGLIVLIIASFMKEKQVIANMDKKML